jgi:DNA-binding transcriptional ArsR family regulator
LALEFGTRELAYNTRGDVQSALVAILPTPRAPTIENANLAKKKKASRLDNDKWTFLSNHTHVAICIARQPDVLLREVAAKIGITERAVQRIVTDLDEAGYLTRIKVGRRNRYRIHGERRLRHRLMQHQDLGTVLELAKPGRKKKATTAKKPSKKKPAKRARRK